MTDQPKTVADQIKAGDRLKCVDANGCLGLTECTIYTALSIEGGGHQVLVKDDLGENIVHFTSRFERLPPVEQGESPTGLNPNYDRQWDEFCRWLSDQGIRLELGIRRALYERYRSLTHDLAEARDQLTTVHSHVKEALELLGVDVSAEGYIPDSWTLREQCHFAARRLKTATTNLEYRDTQVAQLQSQAAEYRKALEVTRVGNSPWVQSERRYWISHPDGTREQCDRYGKPLTADIGPQRAAPKSVPAIEAEVKQVRGEVGAKVEPARTVNDSIEEDSWEQINADAISSDRMQAIEKRLMETGHADSLSQERDEKLEAERFDPMADDELSPEAAVRFKEILRDGTAITNVEPNICPDYNPEKLDWLNHDSIFDNLHHYVAGWLVVEVEGKKHQELIPNSTHAHAHLKAAIGKIRAVCSQQAAALAEQKGEIERLKKSGGPLIIESPSPDRTCGPIVPLPTRHTLEVPTYKASEVEIAADIAEAFKELLEPLTNTARNHYVSHLRMAFAQLQSQLTAAQQEVARLTGMLQEKT